MGAPQRIALQGSTRGLLSSLLLFFLFFTNTSGIAAEPAGSVGAACRDPIARVVSIQGPVQIQALGASEWTTIARLDFPLCNGDKVRTGPQSRSALFIQPESLVRIDRNTTIAISKINANTDDEETLVNFEVPPEAGSACGAGYFISRFPKKVKVKGRFSNSVVEGTEFLVALSCETDQISVFEGKVLVQQTADASSSVLLQSGQTATVGPGAAPEIKFNVRPEDAVQWVIHYPPLTSPGAAIADDCRNVPTDGRIQCLIGRAEGLLRAGDVDQARAQIKDALAIAPESSDAKALLSIISLVRNEKAEALRLAGEATAASPTSAPAWLALSYAQQAAFKLEASLTSSQKAAELDSGNALAFARVAELQLSLGYNREAEKTASKAVELNNSESRAHMILGFVHLAQIKVKEARADFERAIELDSTEPLSRLGLGLAIIRKGNLKEGREQIEIAVALDPTNSLLRSYVGKAYYEEKTKERDGLAATQFGMAKELDPNDPTPWFYDSILKQSQNKPVDALSDIKQSIALNENRAVFRSQLFLDQDSAARMSSLARTHTDIGFNRLGVMESARSLSFDPGDHSAHRYLSEVYETAPRSVVSRESELLQSQIRQPLGISTISPFRGQSNPLTSVLPAISLPSSLGPGRVAFNEFNPLFSRDGLNLFVDGLIAEKDTDTEQVVVSGLAGKASFSVGGGRFNTDGFQENRDFSQYANSVFLQIEPHERVGVQAEYLESRVSRGEAFTPFDPIELRSEDNSRSYRLGASYEISPNSSLVVSGIDQRFSADLEFPAFNDTAHYEGNAATGEIQLIHLANRYNFVLGANQTEGRISLPNIDFERRSSFNNVYGYSTLHFASLPVSVQLGLGYEYYKNDELVLDSLNPKLGMIITPTASTTVRLAAARSIKRPFLGDRTIEPTQVAGFNQFFDDPDGAIAWQYGIAADQEIGAGSHIGVELVDRDIEVPVIADFFRWREKRERLYLYVPIRRGASANSSPACAITAELEHEDLQRVEDNTGAEGIRSLRSFYVPLGLTIFPGMATSIQLRATYVDQDAQLQASPSSNIFIVSDSFWISDLSISYRLPGSRGKLSLGVSNLENQRTSYVNPDAAMARFAAGRIAFARATLKF